MNWDDCDNLEQISECKKRSIY